MSEPKPLTVDYGTPLDADEQPQPTAEDWETLPEQDRSEIEQIYAKIDEILYGNTT